eukprot:GEMP01085448.1.p1 GENE.GEMP01085448.1~~GEMP01085448.1.p1  ORF type:complete len:153 (+),score=38.14 GEMP01085448.1:211-669(+)
MDPITHLLRVNIKFGKQVHRISVPQPYDLRSLRDQIEEDLSIPKAKQKLIAGGKQLHGVAFADDTRIQDCIKADGVIMLMAPADASGETAIDACEESCAEVFSGQCTDPRVVEDLLTKACMKLDSLDLVGKQRTRRKLLLERIDKRSFNGTT